MFNWYRKIRRKRRWSRFVQYWNALNFTITETIKTSKDPDAGFKWNQLIVQEIRMWISLDKKVEPSDFSYICRIRGFDNTMRTFVYLALDYIGLINHSQDYEINVA